MFHIKVLFIANIWKTLKTLLGTKICTLYWRNYVKSGCAIAGLHCSCHESSGYRTLAGTVGQNHAILRHQQIPFPRARELVSDQMNEWMSAVVIVGADSRVMSCRLGAHKAAGVDSCFSAADGMSAMERASEASSAVLCSAVQNERMSERCVPILGCSAPLCPGLEHV